MQRNIRLWRYDSHVALFKALNFMVLFCFTSSDKSEIADWLQSKSLARYRAYPRLKIVIKTFLEKVQHKRATC